MGFSVLVEMLNLRAARKAAPTPVNLHEPYTSELAAVSVPAGIQSAPVKGGAKKSPNGKNQAKKKKSK
jgi:hypothetical protein